MMHQSGPALLERVAAFLFHEAQLIDDRQWQAWGALFTEDGTYWVPSSRDQSDPAEAVSLIYDTPLLRRIRLQRYANNDASSLEQGFETAHHISNVLIENHLQDEGRCEVRSGLIVSQWTPWRQDVFHARCTHDLWVTAEGEFRIACKRVDIVGARGALGDILTLL